MKNYGIHWFRRDLRVAGNEALKWNWQQNEGRVLGLFCFDKKFLARSDFSVNRFQFFLNTLKELEVELKNLGSDLLILDIGPMHAFPELFDKIVSNHKSLPSLVTWNRDYEPFARARDSSMEDFLRSKSISFKHFRDHLIIEPDQLSKTDGTAYQVYTPFSQKWLEIFKTPTVQKVIQQQNTGLQYFNKSIKNENSKIFKMKWSQVLQNISEYSENLTKYTNENLKKVTVEIPPAGSLRAYECLKNFKNSLENYGVNRDYPHLSATSGLSIYLKNGSLTTSQIISFLKLQPYIKKQKSQDVFFSELIWREFYYHILFRFPRVENSNFLEVYKDIKWSNKKEYFELWCEGKTGFPIVDAGMRELKTTGKMHNRVRMIVASFLIKDLLIDWRWGEKHFMEHLLDGDLAANNGGWQWAASTGCDAQPYFRIFNPWLQSKKFDPQGEYIYKFLPELKSISAKNLHSPILKNKDYPEPIVDHSLQRLKAIKMYENAKK